MSFDRDAVRNSERVYLTQDAWDALDLLAVRSEERDRLIEQAVWMLVSQHPGVVDCINERKEALRKFKEKQKESANL